MADFSITINLVKLDREEACAFAQGVANKLGTRVTLLRDNGEIHVGVFAPEKR